MFYLGRAVFYLQGMADPYYTIPDYLPEAKFYALLVRQGVSSLGSKADREKAGAGGGQGRRRAQPVTLIFEAKEIMEWMIGLAEVADAYEINTVHRPYFGDFAAGRKFDYPMPAGRQSLGATDPRAGYPFRTPSDFLLHDSLSEWPMYPQERRSKPAADFRRRNAARKASARVRSGKVDILRLASDHRAKLPGMRTPTSIPGCWGNPTSGYRKAG